MDIGYYIYVHMRVIKVVKFKDQHFRLLFSYHNLWSEIVFDPKKIKKIFKVEKLENLWGILKSLFELNQSCPNCTNLKCRTPDYIQFNLWLELSQKRSNFLKLKKTYLNLSKNL